MLQKLNFANPQTWCFEHNSLDTEADTWCTKARHAGPVYTTKKHVMTFWSVPYTTQISERSSSL